MHDSIVSDYGVYQKMEEVWEETGGRVVVDSAFNLTGTSFLIKSSQTLKVTDETRELIRINHAATSVRQLAEHGMRMLQGQFPRFKDSIRFDTNDAVDRKVSMQLLVLLYNFQTSKIGINTILNTFMARTEGFSSSAGVAFTSAGERVAINASADNLFFAPL